MKKCLIYCYYPQEFIKDGIEKAMATKRVNFLNPRINFNKEIVDCNNYNNIVSISTFNINFHNNNQLVSSYFNSLITQQFMDGVYKIKKVLSKRQPPNLK